VGRTGRGRSTRENISTRRERVTEFERREITGMVFLSCKYGSKGKLKKRDVSMLRQGNMIV